MRGQVQRLKMLTPFYEIASTLIPLLDISNDNARYYSRLSCHYTIQSLWQFQGQIVYLLLLCFTYYRTHYINDKLAESFRYYVRKYETKTKQMIKDYFYQYHLNVNHQIQKKPPILDLFLDENIDGQIPFFDIRKQVFRLLNKKNPALLKKHIHQD